MFLNLKVLIFNFKSMGRTVSYSVVKRNNPLDQDAVPKFYAQAQANGHVEIREWRIVFRRPVR